jgi:hypothetical protein
MLILPSIALRFKSPLIDETFDPVMLISRLPEARFIELLNIIFFQLILSFYQSKIRNFLGVFEYYFYIFKIIVL